MGSRWVLEPVLLSGVCAVVLGCSSTAPDPFGSQGATSGAGTTGVGGGFGTTSGGGGDGLSSNFTTYESGMGPISVASGQEKTQCIYARLENPEPVFVRRFTATLSNASHHMIVYRSDETQEQPTPESCLSFSGLLTGEHAIFIAQQKQASLLFPTDGDVPIGLKIDANQMLRIEMHYVNASPAAIDATGKVFIDTVPVDSTITESDLAFWGTQDINIPPNGSDDTGVKFQQALSATKTFALTTHQHHLGTRMRVWQTDSPDALPPAPLADTSNWSDPPLVLLDPPLTFPQGNGVFSSSGLAYECEWQNNTPQTVGFGESVNDEMCFLWHYYYPSQGFQICLDGLCNTK